MKIIKCKDSEMYPFRLKKCGRIKRIFWDHNGRAYYRRGSMRTYLDTVEKLVYPYFYDDDDGKFGYIIGWEYIGAYSPLYVEILDNGENVQLWEEV